MELAALLMSVASLTIGNALGVILGGAVLIPIVYAVFRKE